MTTTTTLSLTPLPPESLTGLTVYANPNDPRRDLHTFVGYVRGRTIKRTYRGNDLPQADYKRLMQLIPDGDLRVDEETDANVSTPYRFGVEAPAWISYLDWLAHRMGFVSYTIRGTYRGYSSAEPSFPDNFMHFKEDAYNAFLAAPLAEQERRLLDSLLGDYGSGENEFFQVSIRGRLDRFPAWGNGIGMMPRLKFDRIRRFLLDLLLDCEPGTWYGTAELIASLRQQHPFFLIPQPEPPKPVKPTGKRQARPAIWYQPAEQPPKRYGNFFEDVTVYPRTPIPDDAPDGFERVEGRYVERFLEGLPLTLGYVEVAYADQHESPTQPSRGLLRAFRVTERFRQAMRGEIPQPRVTVQPNFEIYVESAFYPAALINRLAPFADLLSQDTTTIFKLQKQKVAAQLAEHADLDLVALLSGLTGQGLPQNVAVELREWAGQAGVFTLYDGFALVESADPHAPLDTYTAERISDTLRLVRDPGALFDRLLHAGAAALRIQHGDAAWTPVPDRARTLFPRENQVPKKKAKQEASLQRQMLIALHISDDGLFDAFRTALLDARCAVEVDKERRTLTLPRKDDAQVKEVMKRLSDKYSIRVEDLA